MAEEIPDEGRECDCAELACGALFVCSGCAKAVTTVEQADDIENPIPNQPVGGDDAPCSEAISKLLRLLLEINGSIADYLRRN